MFSAICQSQQEAANHLLGAYRPVCEENGRFQAAQCFEATCFCADPITGERKDGTERQVDHETMKKTCMSKMSRENFFFAKISCLDVFYFLRFWNSLVVLSCQFSCSQVVRGKTELV